eukprot:m.11544 g.11544  ORF g.11544 m.11544 type:complete len:142 (-) comp3163_c0_seq2:1325-1750(-)
MGCGSSSTAAEDAASGGLDRSAPSNGDTANTRSADGSQERFRLPRGEHASKMLLHSWAEPTDRHAAVVALSKEHDVLKDVSTPPTSPLPADEAPSPDGRDPLLAALDKFEASPNRRAVLSGDGDNDSSDGNEWSAINMFRS